MNAIAVTKILKRGRQLGVKKEPSLDVRRDFEEFLALDTLSRAKKKAIVEQFPEVETAAAGSPRPQDGRLSSAPLASKLLVMIVSVCGLSQEILALLRN